MPCSVISIIRCQSWNALSHFALLRFDGNKLGGSYRSHVLSVGAEINDGTTEYSIWPTAVHLNVHILCNEGRKRFFTYLKDSTEITVFYTNKCLNQIPQAMTPCSHIIKEW